MATMVPQASAKVNTQIARNTRKLAELGRILLKIAAKAAKGGAQ